jgi:hypothetical protein
MSKCWGGVPHNTFILILISKYFSEYLQEKYMSEAYSEEAPDSEAARKLWEFGDDYRNFLDSQSDCASSLGRPPVHRRRRVPRVNKFPQVLNFLSYYYKPYLFKSHFMVFPKGWR